MFVQDQCFACRKLRGEIPIPGGALYEDEYVFANHSLGMADDETVYLGWLIIDLKRHIADLAEITDEEGRALGLAVARLRACENIIGGQIAVDYQNRCLEIVL